MTAKNRVTINLDDNEFQALQAMAKQTDRSLSWLGRKAVCDFLKNKGETIADFTGPRIHGTTIERRRA